jgi:hypothetical protein
MQTRLLSKLSLVCIFAFVATVPISATIRAAEENAKQSANDENLARDINRLVQQLNHDRAAERDAAESKLLELAGDTTAATDKFLALLPEDNDQMPLAVRERLTHIRQQLEDRVAKVAVEATTITLSAKEMPLADVFAAIEKQTGNKLADNREQDSDAPDGAANGITIELKAEPFWPAVDQILDKANLGIYSYGGEDSLSIVTRASDERPRHGAANYAGPFRIDILEVQSQRNLRQPQRQSLKLQMEIAWEPRLRPIALSQPVADVKATTDSGQELQVSQPDAVLDVEVPAGTQAAEIVLPFGLPPRDAKRITTLRGKLRALVPGRQVKFQFDDLANASGKSQRRGGVQVTLDNVRKNNAIWEVHMRLTLDEDNDALQSHRGWAFQNLSYLVDKNGEQIDNAGFETTRQTANEVGLAYLFDLPEGIDGLTWVYETPAAIVELPVEYELKDIELP